MTILKPLELHYDVVPSGENLNVVEIESGEVIASAPSLVLIRRLIIDLETAYRVKQVQALNKEIEMLSLMR